MPELPPLPPRKQSERTPAASGRAPDPRPAKPDPRPMRVVYGAGAVAVASVIAVGLVQPDYAANADQPQETDTSRVADAIGAGSASTGRSGRRAEQPGGASTTAKPDIQVNHVIKYVHLKPGQTAPPGATVISPGQPTPRVIVVRQPGNPPANNPPANNPPPNNPPANKPGPTNPPVVHNPPPVVHPTPPPRPKPTATTRQSGRRP